MFSSCCTIFPTLLMMNTHYVCAVKKLLGKHRVTSGLKNCSCTELRAGSLPAERNRVRRPNIPGGSPLHLAGITQEPPGSLEWEERAFSCAVAPPKRPRPPPPSFFIASFGCRLDTYLGKQASRPFSVPKPQLHQQITKPRTPPAGPAFEPDSEPDF